MEPHEADQIIENNALVKLTHGSVLNWKDLMQLNDDITALSEERDHARLLAARFEEVIAMQRVLIEAMANWDPDERPQPAFMTWARALLSEVP